MELSHGKLFSIIVSMSRDKGQDKASLTKGKIYVLIEIVQELSLFNTFRK
jgi:hypothetical protein